MACLLMRINQKNSKQALMENKHPNPKLIRSFPSEPDLERGLAREREKTGMSVSAIIREALRKFLGL
jgi:hypothetical protein